MKFNSQPLPSQHVSDDLKAYLDGELSSWQVWRVRNHLQKCAECQEEFKMLQTLTEELQKTESEDNSALSPELRAQILEAAHQNTSTPEAAASFPPQTHQATRHPFRLSSALIAAPLVLCLAFVALTLTAPRSRENSRLGQRITPTDNVSDSASSGSFRSPLASEDAAPAPGAAGAPPVARLRMQERATDETRAIGGPVTLTPEIETQGRQVHKQGSIAVAVGDVEIASDNVIQMVKGVSGFIANNSLSSGSGRYAQLEARVPVDKFEEVVRAIGRLGQVRAKSISGQDITSQYAASQAERDVMNRELAVRTSQLNALKAKASLSNESERQRLEMQLLRLRAETASARARFEAMKKLAVLSSLSVTLQEKPKTKAPGTLGQDISQTGRQAWASFLETARIPLTLLIYALAYSPFWLPALLIWRRYANAPRK